MKLIQNHIVVILHHSMIVIRYLKIHFINGIPIMGENPIENINAINFKSLLHPLVKRGTKIRDNMKLMQNHIVVILHLTNIINIIG